MTDYLNDIRPQQAAYRLRQTIEAVCRRMFHTNWTGHGGNTVARKYNV